MTAPLQGQVIVTTRAKPQAAELTAMLVALGADVLEAPAVAIEPLHDYTHVDAAVRNLAAYDWLILTSVNGVAALADRLAHLGLTVASLRPLKLAAIGPATAGRLRSMSLTLEVIPKQYVGEALAEALNRVGVRGHRCLLLHSDTARPALPDALTRAGATCNDIAIYRITMPDALAADAETRLRARAVDWVTFTSSSTFRNFRSLLGSGADATLRSVKLASIGPVTSAAIRGAGHKPTVEADEYTIKGLVAAIRR